MICQFLFRILHIFLQPLELFPKRMQYVFFSSVSMRFIWQINKSYCSAVALNCGKQSFAIDGIGAGIIVGFSVNQQNGSFNFVGITERTHLKVQFRCLAVCSVFILESKWSKGSVISTASGYSCFKPVGMRQ